MTDNAIECMADGTITGLLDQLEAILGHRPSYDYCLQTGEILIRTGLDMGMGGELFPAGFDEDDE